MLKQIKKYINYSFKLIIVSIYTLSGIAYGAEFQSKRYFQNNGGLIDHISPLLIPDNKASTLSNITMDDRGQLSKRSGYTITNTVGALTTSSVNGGGYHNPSSGANFFAVIVGTNVYRTTNSFGGTYSNITSTVSLTDSSSNLAQHTSLNDSLIFCNESDNPLRVTASGNAFALVGSPSKAHTCSTYGSYLILGNTTESGTAYPSRVRWSDINSPDTWPALNFIDIEPNDGDSIIGMVSFKDSIYIFKKRTIYRMMITGLDGPDAFIIRPFVRNIGCWAKNSLRVIPDVGIAFLAQNTAYILHDNELTSVNYSQLDAIGDPIQRTFDTVSRSKWANVVGAVYPHRYQYWLSVSVAGVKNDTVLVYDYIQKAWTVYTNINANMLEQAEDSTGQNVLISGDYLGNVYRQDTGTSDFPSNSKTAIPASYTTADLSMDSPDITKTFKYLYLYTQVDINTTVAVEAAYDFTFDYEFRQDLSLGSTTLAAYDTSVYDTDIYPSLLYKVTRLELNRSARAIKLRFSNSSADSLVGVIGWTIVYALEDYKGN